jgi:hypothetical protein
LEALVISTDLTVDEVEALLDQAVGMHDAEVRRLGNESDAQQQPDLDDLYSRDTLGQLLARLDRHRCRRSSILAGFILDNIVDRDIYAGQADESTSGAWAVLPHLRRAKNELANDYGLPDYFALYLATRQYEWSAVAQLAKTTLAVTEAEYRALFNELIGAAATDRAAFDDAYKQVLHGNVDNYPFDALLPALAELLHDAFGGRYDASVEFRSVSEEIVTFAYTVLAEGRSALTTARMGGYEQFKAACHGLGHAVFGLLSTVPAWAALPADIALTESLAFSFQLVPAMPWFCAGLDIEPNRDLLRWARFTECYFERMYAMQALWEHDYYDHGGDAADLVSEFNAQRRRHLGVIEDADSVARPDYRPLCVEFLHGFSVRRELLRRTAWTDEAAWRSGDIGRVLAGQFERANLATTAEVVAALG